MSKIDKFFSVSILKIVMPISSIFCHQVVPHFEHDVTTFDESYFHYIYVLIINVKKKINNFPLLGFMLSLSNLYKKSAFCSLTEISFLCTYLMWWIVLGWNYSSLSRCQTHEVDSQVSSVESINTFLLMQQKNYLFLSVLTPL